MYLVHPSQTIITTKKVSENQAVSGFRENPSQAISKAVANQPERSNCSTIELPLFKTCSVAVRQILGAGWRFRG